MAQLVEFIGNHPFLVAMFFAVLFLFLHSLYKEKNKSYRNVNVDQMTRLVNQQNAQVLDIRPKDAYAQGHIVNAINMPLEDIKSGNAKVSKLKKKPVVVYDQMGKTSTTASQELTTAGLEQVFNLQGGINAWIGEKLPLSKIKT